jgi:hypothetical protein
MPESCRATKPTAEQELVMPMGGTNREAEVGCTK